MLPLVIPSFVGAFLFVSALGPKGPPATVAGRAARRGPAAGDLRLPGATLTLTLLSYPYVLLTLRGALRNLDPVLDEAARSLGYGNRAVLFRVTLPQLRPALAAGSLLVGLYTLSDFGAVSLMRYPTITWIIFQQYETAFDRTIAALLSLVLVGMALAILLVEGMHAVEAATIGRGRRVAPLQGHPTGSLEVAGVAAGGRRDTAGARCPQCYPGLLARQRRWCR